MLTKGGDEDEEIVDKIGEKKYIVDSSEVAQNERQTD